jgi:hypothetical protein
VTFNQQVNYFISTLVFVIFIEFLESSVVKEMFKKDEEEFNKLHQRFAQPLDNSNFVSPDGDAGFVLLHPSTRSSRLINNCCSPSWVSPEKRSQIEEKRLTIGQYFKLKSADIRELSNSLISSANVRAVYIAKKKQL